jgi:microcystin-dependent protein
MKTIKPFIGLVFLTTMVCHTYGQVGIGNPLPNASSILDLTNTNNKFLLLPTSASAPGSVTNFTGGPSGLMLYYGDNIYYRTSTAGAYRVLGAWVYTGTAGNGIYTPTGMPVSIGIAPVASAPFHLQVADNGAQVTQLTSSAALMLGDNTTVGHMLFDADEIMAKTDATTAGVLKLQDEGGTVEVRTGADAGETTVFTAHGSMDAKGKMKENGKVLLPMGSIIMWSGTTPPAGWALCDGSVQTREDGGGSITVPDLRGRFIVGYNSLNVDYDVIGDNGGAASVSLTKSQIPAHHHSLVNGTDGSTSGTTTEGSHSHTINHDMADYLAAWASAAYVVSNPAHRDNGDWSDSTEPAGNHSHSLTGVTGSGTSNGLGATAAAHENRPPYYTLAFIFKL